MEFVLGYHCANSTGGFACITEVLISFVSSDSTVHGWIMVAATCTLPLRIEANH